MAPESTKAAIAAAWAAGATMVELDVQMTLDGRLVVFHDAHLSRTTNGRGRLAKTSYRTLARLDAGSWFHPRFAGQRILLVSQAMRLIPRSRQLNLEVKATAQPRRVVKQLLPLTRPIRQRLLVSSFDRGVLQQLRAVALPSALICATRADRALREAIRLGCAAWHPQVSLVTPRRIANAHAAGVRVHVWTVDQPAEARRLRRWGVDGIFTNDPARLRKAIS